MRNHIDKVRQKRQSDKLRYYELDEHKCQMCGDVGEDRRSLMVRCLYDVSEVVPEAIDTFDIDMAFNGYYLRVCKSCRGRFLGKLAEWRAECVALREDVNR